MHAYFPLIVMSDPAKNPVNMPYFIAENPC